MQIQENYGYGSCLAASVGTARETATYDQVPHNLPTELTSFVGREHELAEVGQLLQAARLITLAGPGGCGKTRLALKVAANVLSEFPDGVWFVDLVPVPDPARLLDAVTSALGIREDTGRSLLSVLSRIKHGRVLLVLDNCEHLVDAVAELAVTLLGACPNLTVLSTSREALGAAGELVWRVPPLSIPASLKAANAEALLEHAAVRLFVERAAVAMPGFDLSDAVAPDVVAICTRLGGMPLAIELAATRVRFLSVGEIAVRLDDCFRLLTAGSRTGLRRQQTLRAAIDWSYELLSEAERTLWHRLSVFAGSFTLVAAEAVCEGTGIQAGEVLGLLGQLVDKSIVLVAGQTGQTHYYLLEPVRQYGLERLRASGEEQRLRKRHLDWYLDLALRTEPELRENHQQAALARLEREHENLNTALQWTQANGNWEDGLRLAVALCPFWYISGRLSEGVGWLKTFMQVLKDVDPSLRGQALFALGMLAEHQGADTDARVWFEGAVERGGAPAPEAAAPVASGAREGAAGSAPHGLTKREVEVVRLVAGGCSDREVAARLFISTNTVRRHMENIFTKLDICSRGKLTAWAFQNGVAVEELN